VLKIAIILFIICATTAHHFIILLPSTPIYVYFRHECSSSSTTQYSSFHILPGHLVCISWCFHTEAALITFLYSNTFDISASIFTAFLAWLRLLICSQQFARALYSPIDDVTSTTKFQPPPPNWVFITLVTRPPMPHAHTWDLHTASQWALLNTWLISIYSKRDTATPEATATSLTAPISA
jgi:hypothetical protein